MMRKVISGLSVFPDDPELEYGMTATDDSLTIANFEVQAAKDITDVSDRTIVLHDTSGTRVSCGVLSASNLNSVTYDCGGPAAEPAATATDLSVVSRVQRWYYGSRSGSLCRMT